MNGLPGLLMLTAVPLCSIRMFQRAALCQSTCPTAGLPSSQGNPQSYPPSAVCLYVHTVLSSDFLSAHKRLAALRTPAVGEQQAVTNPCITVMGADIPIEHVPALTSRFVSLIKFQLALVTGIPFRASLGDVGGPSRDVRHSG